MSEARKALGQLGEALACRALEDRGHTVIEKRYRRNGADMDVITSHNGVTVFVEVRTKSGAGFGQPAESITFDKQSRIVTVAQDYVMRHHLENSPCRFDVVSVETEFTPPRVTVFEDAFRPGW